MTLIDLEFGFLSGAVHTFCLVSGRDAITEDDSMIRLDLFPDPSTIDVIHIQRSSLAYMRSITRTLPPDPTAQIEALTSGSSIP